MCSCSGEGTLFKTVVPHHLRVPLFYSTRHNLICPVLLQELAQKGQSQPSSTRIVFFSFILTTMDELAVIMTMISVTSTAARVLRIIKRRCSASQTITELTSNCAELVDKIQTLLKTLEGDAQAGIGPLQFLLISVGGQLIFNTNYIFLSNNVSNSFNYNYLCAIKKYRELSSDL